MQTSQNWPYPPKILTKCKMLNLIDYLDEQEAEEKHGNRQIKKQAKQSE